MAIVGKTITQLPVAVALVGTEPAPIVQAGETRKATVQDIADLAPILVPGGGEFYIQANVGDDFAGIIPGDSGTFLKSGGLGILPAFDIIDASDVSYDSGDVEQALDRVTPADDGDAGQVLTSAGGGVPTWTSPASGGITVLGRNTNFINENVGATPFQISDFPVSGLAVGDILRYSAHGYWDASLGGLTLRITIATNLGPLSTFQVPLPGSGQQGWEVLAMLTLRTTNNGSFYGSVKLLDMATGAVVNGGAANSGNVGNLTTGITSVTATVAIISTLTNVQVFDSLLEKL